jgi:hypothetical protein
MICRRVLLQGAILALSGAALGDWGAPEACAGPPPAELPADFLKRASALNYDLAKLWTAFSQVKASYRARDANALWRVSSARLLVIDKGRRFQVRSLRQLRRLAHIVFAAKIRGAVEQCEFAALFLNSDGAMIGDGELWIKEICQDTECRNSKFLVSTIDLPG